MECEGYSCEEHPDTHDTFIGCIRNLAMGNNPFLSRKERRQGTHMYYVYIFLETFKKEK